MKLAIIIIILSFLGILFLNLYIRVKLLKIYKVLVRNNVEFDSSHFFSQEKLEREVLTKYPQYRTEITTFINSIKSSTTIASILIFLIIAVAFILKRMN